MYLKLLWVSMFALMMAGCSQDSETLAEDQETHAESEEVKFQYTAYSEHFEVFAEADPFVAGQMANVLSHFSSLTDFTPVAVSAITLKINVNGRVVEQTLESPLRKGIYSFDIMPEISGVGTMEYVIRTDTAEFRVTVKDVKVYGDAHEAMEAAGENTASGTNTTFFFKEQSWKIEFATAYPVRRSFGQVIRTAAQVQSAPGDEVMVTAKTSGVVSYAGNNLLEGTDVSDGQVLLTIKGTGLPENNTTVRYAEAQNNFEKAKADYERAGILAEDKIVSDKQLLEARTLYENARSVYENLGQNLSAGGQTVSSPMTGFIKERYVRNGQFVEAGQPLALISQNSSLLLRAEIQQKYAPYLHSIQTANIRTPGDNMTYTLEELNGKVLSVGKATTTDNFLIPVNLQIDNSGSFVPGSIVELFMKTLTDSRALTIPNTAMLEEQGNYFVFVQVTPELFEKREIKPGTTDGLDTEVISGLADDERIVTKGAIFIKLAQSTGVLDAHSGHVH